MMNCLMLTRRPRAFLPQIVAIEFAGQWLRTEAAQQRVFEGFAAPQQATESPWIPESQGLAAVELDVDMIVFAGRLIRIDDAQAA